MGKILFTAKKRNVITAAAGMCAYNNDLDKRNTSTI